MRDTKGRDSIGKWELAMGQVWVRFFFSLLFIMILIPQRFIRNDLRSDVRRAESLV